MKKLFLGLVATFMFTAGFAQNSNYCKSAMTVVVASAKATYNKGMTFKDWLTNQTGNSTILTKEEDKFLNDVFNYISVGANSETVFKSYDGVSISNLALLNSKGGLKAIKDGPISSQNRWCIMCLIKLILGIVCEIVPCDGPVIISAP